MHHIKFFREEEKTIAYSIILCRFFVKVNVKLTLILVQYSAVQCSVQSFHGRSRAASEMFDTPCLGTGEGREGG